MSLRQLFIASLLEPKKMAAFRIISIGKVIQYVFIFIILITIFSFFQFAFGIQNQSSSYAGLIEYIDGMEWILYPFAFIIQFVMSTLFVFSRISIMAIVGFYLLKMMKRRGDYRHV
ncbi:MAG: 4-hydroxy-3-methylbut-2-en-1-yl diphosphate synthase, partial [Paenisporosarcina sp.]